MRDEAESQFKRRSQFADDFLDLAAHAVAHKHVLDVVEVVTDGVHVVQVITRLVHIVQDLIQLHCQLGGINRSTISSITKSIKRSTIM